MLSRIVLLLAVSAAAYLSVVDAAGPVPEAGPLGGEGWAADPAPAADLLAEAAAHPQPFTAAAPAPPGPSAGPADLVSGSGPAPARPAAQGQVRVGVHDTQGAPISGARLQLRTAEGVREAATDEEGQARLEDLPAGPARVLAHQAGFELAVTSVAVDPDVAREVSLHLLRLTARRGRVLDEESRRPVPGAAVVVYDARAPDFPLAGATTDARGEFEFATPSTPGLDAWLVVERAPYLADVATVPASAARDEVVDVRLSRGVVVRGTVEEAGGAPVRGAVVQVADAASEILSAVGLAPTSARSDARGAFELLVRAAGSGTRLVARHEVMGVGAAAVTDTAGRTAIRLHGRGTLRGRVVDAQGVGIAGASIALRADGRGMADSLDPVLSAGTRAAFLVGAGAEVARAVSDAAGGFEMRAVPTGHFLASVAVGGRRALAAAPVAVDGLSSAEVEFTVPATALIEGHVLDGRGQGVAGAAVWGTTGDVLVPAVSSGEGGAFALHVPDALGPWALRASLRGIPAVESEVRAGERDAVLRLAARGGVRGAVEPEGAPAALPLRYTLSPQDVEAQKTDTRAGAVRAGLIDIEDLASGRYVLAVHSVDGRRATAPVLVDVLAGQTSQVGTLSLRQASAYTAALRRDGGLPAAWIHVTLVALDEDGREAAVVSRVRADRTGQVAFTGVVAGRYVLRVASGAARGWTSSAFEIAAGERGAGTYYPGS